MDTLEEDDKEEETKHELCWKLVKNEWWKSSLWMNYFYWFQEQKHIEKYNEFTIHNKGQEGGGILNKDKHFYPNKSLLWIN